MSLIIIGSQVLSLMIGIAIAVVSILKRKKRKQVGENVKNSTETVGKNVKAEQIVSGIFAVDRMTGEGFEDFLFNYFKGEGYNVRKTGGLGDYGGDLIIYKEVQGEDQEKTVIQAKRSNGKIDLHAVQEVIGARYYYNVLQGWVITNSYFTNNAKILASSAKIRLWDRDDLIEHITKDNLEDVQTKEENNRFKFMVADNECPLCQGRLITKTNQMNRRLFIGCTNYPDCNFTDDLKKSKTKRYRDEDRRIEEWKKNMICPRCGRKLVFKSHYGGRLFISCTGWENRDQKGRSSCQWSQEVRGERR